VDVQLMNASVKGLTAAFPAGWFAAPSDFVAVIALVSWLSGLSMECAAPFLLLPYTAAEGKLRCASAKGRGGELERGATCSGSEEEEACEGFFFPRFPVHPGAAPKARRKIGGQDMAAQATSNVTAEASSVRVACPPAAVAERITNMKQYA
jgi:hypothetical protein